MKNLVAGGASGYSPSDLALVFRVTEESVPELCEFPFSCHTPFFLEELAVC